MQTKRQFTRARRNHDLLGRYSQTLGELMLRKYTERAIRAARAEAELNSRSKSAFLSAMSHELRTPLNAIIGFSDLMRRPGGVGAEISVEYADHIAGAGRRLLALVSDVLDMSRLQSGSLPLKREACRIAEVLAEAVEATRPLFAAKRQTVETRLQQGLGEIAADRQRLAQLFGNLLSNAGKFTAEGGRVLVMARGLKDGGVTVAIADTGIGMTHEEIVLALRPFAQVQADLARSQEGAGLGLPLAMGIARLHEGSLHLDSQPGRGTTAIVTLPRGRARHLPGEKGKAA
jgi:two-component system cell cycle sensor histidine kinase PleC